MSRMFYTVLLLAMLGLGGIRSAYAQFAVIDVASIVQLVQQVQQLEQQVQTARSQLTQAQAEYAAMTGARGMQQLLSGMQRNYLPADWTQLSQVLGGSAANYPALSSNLQSSGRLKLGPDGGPGRGTEPRPASATARRAAVTGASASPLAHSAR